jgi:integrase
MDHAPANLAALALFMRITGARIGQAVALKWEAVDLSAKSVIVLPAKGYPERTAFITNDMVAMLANLDKGGPVFGFKYRWSVYGPWRATCEAAGIAYVRPHSAGRRAFATAMSRAGVDPKTAAELGGWKSIRLMLDIYTDSNASAAVVNEVFGTNESQANPKHASMGDKKKAGSKT